MRNDAPLPSPRIALLLAALATLASTTGCAAISPAEDAGERSAQRDDALGGTHYTLWIHGRTSSSSTRVGDYDDFSYWGPAEADAGANKRAVNWDGRSRIADSNEAIRRALDCFCTGESWCVIAAHSAGDAQIGYALDLFGNTAREVTDAAPDASGRCGGTGETQIGWNIRWVTVAGGAAGGTELADLGYWAVSDPLTSDLRTGVARSMYDHGETRGAWFYMFAGARGTAYSGVLAGQDDEVIAYHSSGGMSAVGSFCNPGDWYCDGPLEMDEAPSRKGKGWVDKWANHTTAFRDDGESYDHYTRGDWSGIVSVAARDTADYSD